MDSYDYVIVGAGSAGCVMAARLSEDSDVSVLVIEAGPGRTPKEVKIPAAFPKLFKTERDWDYSTVPQEHLAGREIYCPRGKMLGGSSSMNAQMYVRGNPADFDEWASLGNAGWGWSEVLPFFRRSERFGRGGSVLHGGQGPLSVEDVRDPSPLTTAAVQAAVEAGITPSEDINGAEQDGISLSTVTQRKGLRCSTADAFLRPARRRSNLTIVTGAHVTRIVTDDARATGIEYEQSGTRHEVRATREVILSGGAINSPQLLMLSGIGPADELARHGIEVRHHLAGVGQNLQDHLSVPAIFTTIGPPSLLDAEKPKELLRLLLSRKGMLTSNVGEAMAFVRTRDGLEAPDLQLIIAPVQYIDHGFVVPSGHGLTIGAVMLRPESRGAVTLASGDPFAKPLIDPRHLDVGDDILPLIEGIKLARRIASQPALKEIVDDEMWPGEGKVTDDDIAGFIREQAFDLYHPVGTCKMGVGDDAVVDPQLRVRGVEGLRVVDASVMPNITRGNTNAPTIMIAEKAADMIRTSAS